MSYDFMMFKPRRTINAMAEIQPGNLAMQSGEAVKAELSRLYPAITWEYKGDRGWLGELTADGEPYEFRLPAGEDECWTIATTEANSSPALIAKLCAALELLAFDGQSLELIDKDGSRPA